MTDTTANDTPANDGAADRVHAAADVAATLAAQLPRWRLQDGCICRTFRTHSWKATLMVVNAIGHLAEAAWHHPELMVAYDSVDVRLRTHSAKGITDKDYALARKIEEVVGWQPAREQGSPLEGTPAGPRHGYIKHDT